MFLKIKITTKSNRVGWQQKLLADLKDRQLSLEHTQNTQTKQTEDNEYEQNMVWKYQ